MTAKRMAEVITSALADMLCMGCEPEYFDGEEFESCYWCRSAVSEKIVRILQENADQFDD